MSDIWQQLTEVLAKTGEEFGVYTSAFNSPMDGPLYINVYLLSKGDLIAFLKISDRPSVEDYNINVSTLAAVITKAGFIQVREFNRIGQGIAYLKPNDPRREWGIVGMSLEQTQQMIQLVQDPRFQSTIVSFGYNGTIDGMTVNGYTLMCKGKEENTSIALPRKSVGSVINEELKSLLTQYGWVKKSSYVDPRGGIEGDTVYVRL